jgi:hypothetical protein
MDAFFLHGNLSSRNTQRSEMPYTFTQVVVTHQRCGLVIVERTDGTHTKALGDRREIKAFSLQAGLQKGVPVAALGFNLTPSAPAACAGSA